MLATTRDLIPISFGSPWHPAWNISLLKMDYLHRVLSSLLLDDILFGNKMHYLLRFRYHGKCSMTSLSSRWNTELLGLAEDLLLVAWKRTKLVPFLHNYRLDVSMVSDFSTVSSLCLLKSRGDTYACGGYPHSFQLVVWSQEPIFTNLVILQN